MNQDPKPDALSLARRLRKILSGRLGNPVEVILFGSHVRGAATEDSDIDVLVVLPDLRKSTLDTALEAAWEMGFEAGKVISVVPATSDEMERLAASPFFQAVREEGIPA